MAIELSGARVVRAMNERTAGHVERLLAKGIKPTLAIVRVGARPDDVAYEYSAVKRCGALGITVNHFPFPSGCAQEELTDTIHMINKDSSIHGCLIFRPLPSELDEQAVCGALCPEKDVDGITAGSMAGVYSGADTGFPPCTAQACMDILEHYGYALGGKRVAVVGRSLVVGRPAAMMAMLKRATVTVCNSRTPDLAAVCREADVIIAAAGRAGLIGADCLRPGQAVIDVGMNCREDGTLCGDVDFDQAMGIVEAITPVPGGVGPVTTAVLAAHVVSAAMKLEGKI